MSRLALTCLWSLLIIPVGCAPTGKPSSRPAATIDPTQATAEIQKLGGKITVDETSPTKPVVGINLSDTAISDSTLLLLAAFPQLQTLDIGRTSKQTQAAISDAGLAKLQALANLRHLSLGGTGISDAGLANLKGLNRLQHLNLDRTKVTDAGLMTLAGFPELKRVKLKGTAVTDAGVTKLQSALPNLRVER